MLKHILYDWNGWNGRIFYAINSIHSPIFQKLMLLGSFVGMFKLFPVYLVFIAACSYIDIRQNPGQKKLWLETFAVLVFSYLASIVWVHLCKDYFHLPRPYMVLPEVNILDSVRSAEQPFVSFPSGHTVFVVLMAAALWPVLNCFGKALNIIYVIWVGVSRIALGVHFPADVLWSGVISLLAVMIIRAVLHKILRRYGTPA